MEAEEPSKNMTFAVINVRSKRDVSLYVEWAEINEIHILAITEASEDIYCDQSFPIFRDEGEGKSVAVIVIDQSLRVKLPHLAQGHAVLKLVGTGLTIHFWYVPPAPSGQEQLKEMEIVLAKAGRGIIHSGDFNAVTGVHGSMSKSVPPITRGKAIMNTVSKGNLVLVSKHETITFSSDWDNLQTSSTSCLDWTLVSPELAERIKWEAVPPMYSSDHAFIVVELREKVPRKRPEEFQRLAPAAFLKTIVDKTSDGDTSKWLDHYQDAIEEARKAYRKRKAEAPNEYLQLLKERIDKLSKMVRAGGGCYTDKRKELRELATAYRMAKEDWKMKSDLERMKSVSTWKDLKRLPNANRAAGRVDRVIENNETLTGAEACNILLEKFFVSTENELVTLPDNLSDDDEPLTSHEIQTAIQSFENGKAPGLSGVNTDLIRKWYIKSPQYINDLLTEWFQEGAFPEELKTMMIVGLVKDKRKKQTKENTRPIALTDALGKVYEKVVDTRLMYHVERAKLLSPKQHGYRKGMNPIDALEELERFNELNKKRYKLILQTDVKAAFDGISQKAIIDTLVEKKLPGNITRIIFRFMRERTAVMMLSGETVSRTVCRGVPQGSCLGPHLYILTANLILEKLEETLRGIPGVSTRIIAYADDVVVAAAAKDMDTASSHLRRAAETMSEALSRIGLEMATGKLKALKDVDTATESLQWGDLAIPLVETAKILGVTFSSNRKFDEHLEEVECKMNTWLKNNEKLINKWSGLRNEMTSKLIKQVLLPKLTYGAAIWNTRFGNNSRAKAMKERISRATSIAMIGAPRETGKTAASLLTKEVPFHVKCDQMRLEKELKARLLKQKRRIEVNTSVVELGHPAKRLRETVAGTVRTDEETRGLEADLTYYTDGSKYEHNDEQVTGAAFIKFEKDQQTGEQGVTLTRKFKLKPENSVFQAEAMAIGQALIDAERAGGSKSVLILSDSLSAIQAISEPEPRSRLIGTCKNVIRRIRQSGRQVSLNHVKAHNDITGNEMVDEEAKDAAINGIEVDVPVPISWIKKRASEEAKKIYQQWYEKSADGREIKKYFSGPDDRNLKHADVNRATIPLYAGHGHNLSSMRWGFKGAHENCKCGQLQTMQHLLFECERMMETNVATALQAGMSVDQFFASWTEKVNNPKTHRYISLRARTIHKEIRQLNSSYVEMDELSRALWNTLTLIGEDEAPVAPSHEGDPANVWLKDEVAAVLNPRLMTGVAMTQWAVPGVWTDGTAERNKERWTISEDQAAEAQQYEGIRADGREWRAVSDDEDEVRRWEREEGE